MCGVSRFVHHLSHLVSKHQDETSDGAVHLLIQSMLKDYPPLIHRRWAVSPCLICSLGEGVKRFPVEPLTFLCDVLNCCRCLRDGELFEIVIQKMVDRWSGSIEAGEMFAMCPAAGHFTLEQQKNKSVPLLVFPCLGVTAIRPEELEFPNTMTDIDYDTWMLRY